MEFAEGGTLAKRVCASLSTDDARRWSLQLARVLEYIHDQSMAHRDLKPENVFLTKALDIKLGDFGLAKDLGPNSSTTMSQAMTQVGTTNYFSPELGEGLSCGAKGSVRGNDMWALGCIVIELVRRERLDASLWPPEVSGNRDKLLADALAADPLLGTATTLMLVEYHMRCSVSQLVRVLGPQPAVPSHKATQDNLFCVQTRYDLVMYTVFLHP